MGIPFVSNLWLLALLSVTVLAGMALAGQSAGLSLRVRPGVVRLALAALLLIAVGLGTRYGLSLPDESPRLGGILQGLLPVLLACLGGVLAARAFIARQDGCRHSLTGLLVLAPALGLVLLTDGTVGILMDSAAVLALLFAGLLTQRLGAHGRRRLRLGAALALFWSGTFLVYLQIFPAQVAVEAAEDMSATGAAAPVEFWLWAAPLVFLAAFLLGFFKRQRG